MADAHEFAVSAHELDAGGKTFDFAVRRPWVEKALSGTQVEAGRSDGTLSVRLSKSGTDVVVRGSLCAQLVVPCARCLEPATVVIEEPLSALVVPSAAIRESMGDDDGDLAPDQADLIPYDGETVVLDDLVRDELLLGIPMIPLCSDSCPGIRPPSGEQPADGTMDRRLGTVLSLKTALKKSPNH